MTNPADNIWAPTATAGPAPGWYPDPWRADQQRYWDGTTWTGHVYANVPTPTATATAPAPAPAWPAAPAAVTTTTSATSPTIATSPTPASGEPWAPTTPWAPAAAAESSSWAAGTAWADTAVTPGLSSTTTSADTLPGASAGGATDSAIGTGAAGRPPSRRAFVIGLVALALLVFLGAFATALALGHKSRSTRSSAPPVVSPLPSPNTSAPNLAPATPADPSAATLSGLGIIRSDLAATVPFGLLPGGTSVTGQTTLDLCNGTFPSEALRTARRQVEVDDGQGNVALSTEAVLYTSPAATAQAFSELKSVVAKCPATAVPSPVGEPPVTTHFNAAPDAAWPQVAGVERLAYDFTVTDSTGKSQHGMAVYLRNGRVLMGVYINQPDVAQVAVAGQTSIPGIVNVFAQRLAAVPASVANGVATN